MCRVVSKQSFVFRFRTTRLCTLRSSFYIALYLLELVLDLAEPRLTCLYQCRPFFYFAEACLDVDFFLRLEPLDDATQLLERFF